MTRKTPKAVLEMLDEHDASVAYWATKTEHYDGQPVTEDFRIGVLTGLNMMIETALHKHKCYRGFRYVKHVTGSAAQRNVPGTPGLVNGLELVWNQDSDTPIGNQVRQYFRGA